MTAFAALSLSVLADQTLTLSELRTYCAIASFASPTDPTCYPSRRAIAVRLGGVHPDTVSRSLRGLKARGLIEVTQRRHRSSLYRLTAWSTSEPELDLVPDLTPTCLPEQTTLLFSGHTPLPPTAVGGEEVDIVHPDTLPDLAVVGHQVEVQEDTRAVSSSDLRNPTPQIIPEPSRTRPTAQERQEQRQQRQQERQGRIQAARRLVARLNAITGAQLDTASHSNATRRAARLLRSHEESEIAAVIESKGREFHHPAGILRRSVFEAIQAERRQHAAADAARRQRERAVLEQVRAPVNATRDGARAGLGAVFKALGVVRE